MLDFAFFYKILMFFPIVVIILSLIISLPQSLQFETKLILTRKNFFKSFFILTTVIGTIGLSFFASIHVNEEIKSDIQVEVEVEIQNKTTQSKMNHDEIIQQIQAKSSSDTLFSNQQRTPASTDLKRPITVVFFEKYIYSAFISLSVLGSLIALCYGWLNTEYRRFNDLFVDYCSRYYSMKKPQNKELYLRKVYYLLKEEYIMFFQMNLAYSEFKFGYLFKPYFYILNICYACGLDMYIDIWHKAFVEIAKSDTNENDKLYAKIKELISHNNNQKEDEYTQFIKNLAET